MSESVSNDVSTESLCTVIDAKLENNNYKNYIANSINKGPKSKSVRILDYVENENNTNGHLSSTAAEDTECETEPEKTSISKIEQRSKLKKSVSFDPNDEKIKKFIAGEPIVDQQNPFKSNSLGKNRKRIPPPVPTKRSTLSVRKTVTQQLREREREREKEKEKEKEKERIKNEANRRKNLTHGTTYSTANGTLNGTNSNLNSPDDYITTEEVLNQSKYVKTYIKNPDPYFIYDPTVLARLKFEELRELTDKKQQRKLKLKEAQKGNKKVIPEVKTKLPTFKKCSKPNYPNLSDIKIKVGTDLDGSLFNPAEVTKNARKFDERAKKLHLSSDDDLDEIDGPLTKSESSDEVATITINSPEKAEDTLFEQFSKEQKAMQSTAVDGEQQGTFTNTIKSKEFQEYLEKKGLTLIPKKIPNGAQALYSNGHTKNQQYQASFKVPAQAQISVVPAIDKMETSTRKPSVFQRLLANSIFASRRRTTPKEQVPTPRSVAYEANPYLKQNISTPAPIKRVVLERQSFHGRPRLTNTLLSLAESNDLKRQTERSRKSFASGDDLSLSISSALTNAESNGEQETDATDSIQRGRTKQEQPIAKPPRRTLSRDRLHKPGETGVNPSKSIPNGLRNTQSEENVLPSTKDGIDAGTLRRTLERQSLIPKRSMTDSERRQVFGRSSSMDRNEILKRNAMRGLQHRAKSINDTTQVTNAIPNKDNTKDQFRLKNSQIVTSTPIRESSASNMESQSMTPVQVLPSNKPGSILIEQQEWKRLCAMKERTDRELYYKVRQQQQQQQEYQQQQQEQQEEQQQQQQRQQQQQPNKRNENIYEHLQVYQSQQAAEQHFLRGSPQRNTFSGVTNNRQAKIIDGKAVIVTKQANMPRDMDKTNVITNGGRSQSVLDNITSNEQQSSKSPNRRGYESECETPVVLRRKTAGCIEKSEPRRIGGLLTREEILQKVKEFCRKSLIKTPTNANHPTNQQFQAIYERQATNSIDLSPVSYASVETQQRPISRLYAAPQVPQRFQSLPQQFMPIKQELVALDSNGTNGSPIYAHVIKRSSLQSQQSNDHYDSPQRPILVRRASDAKTIYLTQSPNSLQLQPETALSPVPTQYVIVDNDKPTQLVSLQPATEIYAQPQYVRPSQMHAIPNTYGYITVREPMTQLQQMQHTAQNQTQQQQQTYLRQRLYDGRSTPLILDRSSQQASQIYWTPQHQRLQQQAGLIPVHISPRYVIKQSIIYPSPAQRTSTLATSQNYIAAPNEIVYRDVTNIPQQQQQQQQFSPIVRVQTPTRQLLRHSVQFQHQQQTPRQQQQQQQQDPSDWESGSEAGEVRRIMKNQRNHVTELVLVIVDRRLHGEQLQSLAAKSK